MNAGRQRLLAELEIGQHRSRADLPWIYVTSYRGEPINAGGPYPTAEAALIAAQQESNADPDPDTTHKPIPLFPPKGESDAA